jgi:hypothetical protein
VRLEPGPGLVPVAPVVSIEAADGRLAVPELEQLVGSAGEQPELARSSGPACRRGAPQRCVRDRLDGASALRAATGPGGTCAGNRRGLRDGTPELVVCPELAFLVQAARHAAWTSHCNLIGLRYAERRDALARLRGALRGYDLARGAV